MLSCSLVPALQFAAVIMTMASACAIGLCSVRCLRMGAGRDVRPPTWKHIVLLAEMKYFESPDVYKHRGSNDTPGH